MALIFQSSSQNGQLSRNRLLSRFISWHIFLVHLQSQRSKSRLRTTKLKKRKPLWFPTFLLLQVEAFFLLFLRSRCGDRVTTIYRFYYCCHQPLLLLQANSALCATFSPPSLYCVCMRQIYLLCCCCYCWELSFIEIYSTLKKQQSSYKNLLLNEWQVCIELLSLSSSNINAYSFYCPRRWYYYVKYVILIEQTFFD